MKTSVQLYANFLSFSDLVRVNILLKWTDKGSPILLSILIISDLQAMSKPSSWTNPGKLSVQENETKMLLVTTTTSQLVIFVLQRKTFWKCRIAAAGYEYGSLFSPATCKTCATTLRVFPTYGNEKWKKYDFKKSFALLINTVCSQKVSLSPVETPSSKLNLSQTRQLRQTCWVNWKKCCLLYNM